MRVCRSNGGGGVGRDAIREGRGLVDGGCRKREIEEGRDLLPDWRKQ